MTKNFLPYIGIALSLILTLPLTGCSDDKDAPDPLTPEITINDCEGVQDFSRGESKTYTIETLNIESINTSAPEGWTAECTENELTITAPADDVRNAVCSGDVTVKIVSKDEIEREVSVAVSTYELRFLTFEDADAKFSPFTLDYCNKTISKWSDLIDDPQYGGEMLYGDSGYGMDEPYQWYDENNTELRHLMAPSYGMYCYWSGGHAISNYADTDISNGNSMHQLTVYGTGGHNGSQNFAIHFGYKDNSSFGLTETLPSLEFADGVARIIDHLWVTNNTYAINCYIDGNGLTAKIGPDDWVQIVAKGYDESGAETGEAKIYLCNGPDNIVRDWTKWDLSALGKVAKVEFNITGSSDNGYGYSQPAYFAYDDVAVRF